MPFEPAPILESRGSSLNAEINLRKVLRAFQKSRHERQGRRAGVDQRYSHWRISTEEAAEAGGNRSSEHLQQATRAYAAELGDELIAWSHGLDLSLANDHF